MSFCSAFLSEWQKDLVAMAQAIEEYVIELLEQDYAWRGHELSFGLIVCSASVIRSMNKEFRRIDKATDVLSFPTYDDLRGGGEHDFLAPCVEMGDIYICREVAEQQAFEHGIALREEFVHLCFHGLAHLLGYDHEISALEQQLMQEVESDLISRFKKYRTKNQ